MLKEKFSDAALSIVTRSDLMRLAINELDTSLKELYTSVPPGERRKWAKVLLHDIYRPAKHSEHHEGAKEFLDDRGLHAVIASGGRIGGGEGAAEVSSGPGRAK